MAKGGGGGGLPSELPSWLENETKEAGGCWGVATTLPMDFFTYFSNHEDNIQS